MQSILFWAEWPRPFKQLYTVLLLLFVGALAWLASSYFQGYEVYLDWDIQGQAETTEVDLSTVKVGPFNITNTANNTIYTQRFASTAPETNIFSYYLFFFVTLFCANLLVTVISTLPRFSFYVGAAFIVLFFMNMKLELLYLFGSEQKIGLIVALLLYLPTSFYFNRIRSEVPFITRGLVFTGLSLVIVAMIFFGAQVEHPFVYIAAASILNPIVISLVFILMVAHEIIASIIFVLTRSNTPSSKNTLVHFTVITLIYFPNLVLAYLHETRTVDWDILYLNTYLLLGISATLGLWGYQRRESQYGYLFRFFPVGALFYITMAVCCFVTLGHFMTTANDPALEIFRDITIYSHIGYGLIFVLYIISNFITPLKDNMKVYKVLYSPISMPYFTFRLAGLIASVALLVRSNWEVPVNQGISAYYNSLGDLHLYTNETPLAERYYEEAAVYGYNNHKSNFALASLLHERNEVEKAAVRYQDALKKWPSPQAHINLSNLYVDDDRFFDALFVLREGADIFPGHGAISNNLGLLYGKTRLLDSAMVQLDRAYQRSSVKGAAASNVLALLSSGELDIDADSVLAAYPVKEDPISLNNHFVLYNHSEKYLGQTFTPTDTVLDFLEASILYNQAFNQLYGEDSLETGPLISLVNKPANVNARESLKFVACLNLYKNHNANKAFRELNWLANTSISNGGQYFNQVGTWALGQAAPEVAIDYFQWAANKDWEEARFNLAIAYSESGDMARAIEQWQTLQEEGEPEAKQIAATMLAILTLDMDEAFDLADPEKYLVSRYTLGFQDTVAFQKLVATMEDDNYKAQAYLDMCNKLWRMDYPAAAAGMYVPLAELKITDEKLFRDTQWFELKMLAAQKNVRALATKINQGVAFDTGHLLEKHFYTGLLNEASGDTLNARKNYELIAYMNPFFEEAVIHSAAYIGLNDRFEAYNILLSAIELNPMSVKLLKAYILQCARVQLNSYAENSLQTLRERIPATDYIAFESEYQQLIKEVEQWEENF